MRTLPHVFIKEFDFPKLYKRTIWAELQEKKKRKLNMKEVVSFIASIEGLMHSKQTATTKVQVNVERHALTLNQIDLQVNR